MSTLSPRTTPPLIGLCGGIGCGKSAAADFLTQVYDFTELSFAQRLKNLCVDLYQIDAENIFGTQEEKAAPIPHLGVVPLEAAGMGDPWPERVGKPWTGRWVLEWMGTNACRLVWGPVWVESVRTQVTDRRKAHAENGGEARHVVSDVRFQNEADMIRELGGIVVRVEVDGYTPEATGHSSDAWYQDAEVDFIVRAPKPGLSVLHGELERVLERYDVGLPS